MSLPVPTQTTGEPVGTSSAAPVVVGAAPRRRPRSATASVLATGAAAVIGCVFILPAAWIVIGSFRPNLDILSNLSPLSWQLIVPTHVTLGNYSGLLTSDGFGVALLNSLIVCLASVVAGLVVSAMAAYALSVFHFPGREVVFAVVVISFMVPFEAIAIPLSQLFTSWGLGNTLTGLVLPGIGNGLAVFNLRQYFLGIPSSYREAAMLDGASEPRILTSIFVPMSGPALTNSALLIFLGQWTAYLWPLLMVSDKTKQLAPVALASTFGEHSADYGANFAGAVLLSLVPAVSIFVLQRFFGRLSMASGEK
jgi:multiple sugar transport system permease protein/putative chitobiose transport system permease protein